VLGKVSTRTGTPIASALVVGVGAAIALAVNWNQSAVFTALASLCIAMLYLAYLGVTMPLLVKRLRLWHTGGLESGVAEDGRPLFTLGKWGVAVNVAAVGYQVVMVVNLLWPRPEIYDLTGGTWWLKWSALLFIAATLALGALIHWRNRVRHGGAIMLGVLDTSADAQEVTA
jgi:amino acid transporter